MTTDYLAQLIMLDAARIQAVAEGRWEDVGRTAMTMTLMMAAMAGALSPETMARGHAMVTLGHALRHCWEVG